MVGSQDDGTARGWAVELSERGDVQWERTYGVEGPPPRDATFTAAVPTDDGGALLVGWAEDHPGTDRVGLVVKVDENGTVEWNQTYDDAPNADDEFHAATAVDGGFLLAGVAEADQPRRSGDGWVVRIDGEGTVQWSQRYEAAATTPETERFDALHAVTTAADGDTVLAGETRPAGPDADAAGWALRIDDEGAVEWTSTYDREVDDGFAAAVRVDDGFAFGGRTGDSGWIVGVDEAGVRQWAHRFAGSSFEGGAALDEGAVFVGTHEDRGWAVRVDGDGETRWGALYESGTSLYGVTPTGTEDGFVAAGAVDGDGWALQVGPPTEFPSPTPTETPTETPTPSPTPSPTETQTPTDTSTPTPTDTSTPTETPTEAGGTPTEAGGTPTGSSDRGPGPAPWLWFGLALSGAGTGLLVVRRGR